MQSANTRQKIRHNTNTSSIRGGSFCTGNLLGENQVKSWLKATARLFFTGRCWRHAFHEYRAATGAVVAPQRSAVVALIVVLLHVALQPAAHATSVGMPLALYPATGGSYIAPLQVEKSTLAQRALFKRALLHLERGDDERFDSLVDALASYPIQRYLQYERLRTRFTHWQRADELDQRALAAIADFREQYADGMLSARLVRHLQRLSVKSEQTELFLAASKEKGAASMLCARVQQLEASGALEWNERLRDYWVSAPVLPPRCRESFERLRKQSSPGIKWIWERIYNAIDKKQLDAAKTMAGWLSSRDRKQLLVWIDARENPEPLIKSQRLKADTLLNRRAMLDLMRRWSWQDPASAQEHWQKVSPRYAFFDDERYELSRELALRAGWRKMPVAYDWLNSFEARDDDLEVLEWRVRAALLLQDWKALLKSLAQLPQEEQEEDHWAYWHARALEATGQQDKAEVIYREVAELATYHGFLAADRIGAAYNIADVPIATDAETLQRLRGNERLMRAREYAHVGVAWASRAEWQAATADMTPEDLAGSAVLAAQWNLPDRAILSAGRAEQRRAVALRFPVIYVDEIARQARRFDLQPAIMLGLMRRESGFIADIKSPAGAVGLMQLMPATARFVAGKIGRDPGKLVLTHPETNIEMGAWYLRFTLDRYEDHIALAAASYNAGPHRVKKWLPPTGSVPADVWIDTIPFDETRRYARAILAYATLFEWRMNDGETTRLEQRLPSVNSAELLAVAKSDDKT